MARYWPIRWLVDGELRERGRPGCRLVGAACGKRAGKNSCIALPEQLPCCAVLCLFFNIFYFAVFIVVPASEGTDTNALVTDAFS